MDAVGDIAGARLGPYENEAAAKLDYADRQAAKKQVPVPVEYVYLNLDGTLAWYARNPKWGPSIGLFQVRSLRDPNSGNAADKLRVASDLRDPVMNAKAAYAIYKSRGDFSAWSVFVHGTYEQFLDQDYEVRAGHARADDWDL